MTSTQVERIIHTPRLVIGSGSSAYVYLPICVGHMQGVATFFGLDRNLSTPGVDSLEAVVFSAGAMTSRGVGIGSTRAEVVRAYGSQLHTDTHGLYLVGNPTHPAERPAIYFEIENNKVISLGYGLREQLLRVLEPMRMFC
jgi:hypothetical protein